MKQFIVDRHTTPNTPTLEQVPTEKIPIYENRAAVTADLANLSVGQIVATKDTGDELAQPVDVVEEGNLHAVTSNAVAESLSYSTTEQKTGGVWIDGKPIYRKVITHYATVADIAGTLDNALDNPETIVSIQGVCQMNDNTMPLPWKPAGNESAWKGYIALTMATSKIYVEIYTSTYNHSPYNVRITIEYTKATD